MTDDRPPQPEHTTTADTGSGTGSDYPPGPSTSTGPAPDPGPHPGMDPGPQPHPEPPPLTAFAWRNGLVRPTQGRLLTGVCGALARATNTDPVLWRVIIAVLTIFGGIGVLAYLLGWLLLPADGDTASPIEAVLGRGHSRTSAALTVIAGVVALLSVGAFVSEPFRPGILVAVLLGGGVLLLLRDQRGRSRPTPAPTGPMWSGSTWSGPAAPPPPYRPAPSTSSPSQSAPFGPGPVAQPGYPPQPPVAPTPPFGPGQPFAPQGPGAPPPFGTPPPFATQQPFAPRGPFVGGLPPQPPTAPRFAPPMPKPRPPRSRLGRLTLSLVLIVLGVLVAFDLTFHRIPTSGYVAAALGTVAVGLLVGSWFGRARWLIAPGIVLAVVLTSIASVGQFDRGGHGGTVTWAPTSMTQLQSDYGQDVGDLRIDLSKIDFATSTSTSPVVVNARIDVGSLTVILPPNVDVVVDATIKVGDAQVLGQQWNGLGLDPRTVSDNGADGVGGGTLHLSTRVNLGSLEVTR